MHSLLPYLFLGVVVLQQMINVVSVVSPVQSADNDAGRPNVARRLRAPLMGRSIIATVDDVAFPDDDLSSSNNDEDGTVLLDKRRYGVQLLGRRRWAASKRRGPLFG